MTVSLRMSTAIAECLTPLPYSLCAGGLGDAGKTVHMDLLGEKQNGGGLRQNESVND